MLKKEQYFNAETVDPIFNSKERMRTGYFSKKEILKNNFSGIILV